MDPSTSRNRQSGFAVSSEVLLIAVVLVCGLISGWAKLRDQSSSEIKDAIDAIDKSIAGMGPQTQPYAQQWITGAGEVGCSMTGPQPVPPASCAAPVDELLDPDGLYGGPFAATGPQGLVYRAGVLGSTSIAPTEHDAIF